MFSELRAIQCTKDKKSYRELSAILISSVQIFIEVVIKNFEHCFLNNN